MLEIIDMGLSVKWSSYNLGASSPEEYGDYYAWGEIKSKRQYSWQTYRWCKDSYDTQTRYNTKYDFGQVDYKILLEKEDDAAFMQFGEKWRIPSLYEWYELFEKCSWQVIVLHNVKGYLVVSRLNGNRLFLPGMRFNDELGDIGKFGFYWSSSLEPNNPDQAWSADLSEKGKHMFSIMRYRGYSIRPVFDY